MIVEALRGTSCTTLHGTVHTELEQELLPKFQETSLTDRDKMGVSDARGK
jgi:hypothetical protein